MSRMIISQLGEALAAMDYLHKRGLMCDRCGWKLAIQANANHFRCADCKPPHGDMYAVKATNEFEQRLCEAVHEWIARNTSSDGPGQGPAGTADSSGEAGAP